MSQFFVVFFFLVILTCSDHHQNFPALLPFSAFLTFRISSCSYPSYYYYQYYYFYFTWLLCFCFYLVRNNIRLLKIDINVMYLLTLLYIVYILPGVAFSFEIVLLVTQSFLFQIFDYYLCSILIVQYHNLVVWYLSILFYGNFGIAFLKLFHNFIYIYELMHLKIIPLKLY